MKLINRYILPLVLCIVSLSCKKGWLDATSSAQIRADDQFNTEAGFKDALIGVYIGMTDRSMYAEDMTWHLADLLAQQYNTLSSLAPYSVLQSYQYKSVTGMPRVDAMWNKAYAVIANINLALENIEKNKMVLHAIHYALMKGELLGLRAFIHFDLLRFYGYGNLASRTDISGKLAAPYVTKFSKQFTLQVSYSQTFELMQNDIAASLELLKEDPVYKTAGRPADYYSVVNRDGFYNKREQRMNYYAVKALQARMLLWQGGETNLQAAKAAAEEVIANAPAKLIDPSSSPASDRILYGEHLFNLNVTAFENIVNPYLIAEDAAQYNALFMLRANAESLYEAANPGIGIPDKRFNTLLETQSRGLVPVKLHQRNTGIRNVMPLMRVSEMYYIAAEAYLKTNLSKAIDDLNIVRRSRGIIQDIPSASNETTVRAELTKEYRKEFVSEGQLFFFYKRLGMTSFPGLATSLIADDKIYVLPYPDAEIEFGNRVQ